MAESRRRRHKSWYSKLILLIWKNFLLRKQHWVLTLFEIAIPTLLFVLLVTIRVLPDSVFTPTLVNETTTFQPANETKLREMFCNNTKGIWLQPFKSCWYLNTQFSGDRKFLYGPPNNFTKTLIEDKLSRDLKLRPGEIMSVSSNEELDDTIDSLYLQSNASVAPYYVGFFFHLDDLESNSIPKDLSYDIRMQKYWFTDLVFPYLQVPGPRNYTGEYPYIGGYTSHGFSLLQTLIDRYYLEMVSTNFATDSVQMETQMYPYPPYVQDNAMSQFYGSGLPLFVMLSLVLLSPALIKSIVHEKETGVRELVRLMGLEGWLVWLGWFIHSFMMVFAITLVMTFFLKVKITPSSETGLLPPILIYSDTFLIWLLLILYGISSIAFCFAISCFFSKPTLATTVGILLWLLSYSIPRGLMDLEYDNLGLAPKITSCLLPNMAMTWAFRVISMFEGRAIGIHWNNLWDTGNPRDELTPAMILIMLTVDIVLYFLITWYFDQVLPGKYGVPKPWYFPFQTKAWKKAKQNDINKYHKMKEFTTSKHSANENFEYEPTGLKSGIIITNLRKEFPALGGGVKVAVEDVNLVCYEGQCTVLLGHNGAGKTTTMSVITGVFSATSGSASILGYDIATHLKEAREEVGLCPQHNTLFADLSVEDHLYFFAQLKGLSRSEAKKEAKELLRRMQLTEKKNQHGKQLSGGMKRKLCLCIALIGGSKVVILDEPSSGLDPESRRWVWDAVQRERIGRTLLVTTHHMEEADVLGDRVAIMASGRVVCAGSTLFLKKRFGEGYSLRVLTQKSCNVSSVTHTVHKLFPSSELSSSTHEELIYSLPPKTDLFADLLQELTDKKKVLKIIHVGLSLTTLEEVFLRVGETLDPAVVEAKESERKMLKEVDRVSFLRQSSVVRDPEVAKHKSEFAWRLTGFALQLERLKSLWMKRIIYSRRKWILLLTQGLIPVAVTLMCLFVDAAFFGESAAQPSRDLDLDMFEWTHSFYEEVGNTSGLGTCYKEQFRLPNEVEETYNLTETLLQVGISNTFHYRENYVTSAQFTKDDADSKKLTTRMLYQSIPYHANGVGINLISNALLQCFGAPNHTIRTNNYPLPYDKRYRLEDGATSGSAMVYYMMMPTALAFLSASFIVFPLQERHSKSKQVQLMTGTSALALWLTSYTWDLFSYCLSALLVFICFVTLDSQGSFTLPGGPGALWVLLLCYGVGSLPLSYVFSFPFSTAASGFSILALLNILTGLIISTATWALSSSKQPGLVTLSAWLGNVSSLVPSYPAALAFKNFIDTSTYNTQCDIVSEAFVEGLCETLVDNNIPSPFLPCCPNCDQLTGLNVTCFEPISYFSWSWPGIGQQLLWMLIDCVFYFVILWLIEIGAGSYVKTFYYKLVRRIVKIKELDTYVVPVDDDVVEEARVARLLMAEEKPDAALVVSGLRKEFVNVGVTAVSNLSFRVAKSECFGLLGVNGAGKTTTFRMLTGDEVATAGDARIGRTFLSKSRNKFVREIGYCPQFDALLDELTGEEMLSLMAGLRGVPRKYRQKMIDDLVELVDITECHRRQTSTYSGGNKRKLSTAMALVGDPALVFLDEPTTGVDPASRRRVWSAIRSGSRKGQSIILTSHSMDECEALCSRLVIMVRGQLRCEGSPAHLKAKFSNGYSLQVKLHSQRNGQPMSEEEFKQSVAKLQSVIQSRLPGSSLTDKHRGMLAYLVPPGISWSSLVRVMEDLKRGEEGHTSLVEDYAATDPSLEQVFLTFAREADQGLNTFDTSESIEVTEL